MEDGCALRSWRLKMVVWVRQGVRVVVFRTVCVHEEASSVRSADKG